MPLGASFFFFENVPLVEFIYLVFTRTPGGVIVGDSGLCSCVPCLSSAIISLCSLYTSALGLILCQINYNNNNNVLVQRPVLRNVDSVYFNYQTACPT